MRAPNSRRRANALRRGATRIAPRSRRVHGAPPLSGRGWRRSGEGGAVHGGATTPASFSRLRRTGSSDSSSAEWGRSWLMGKRPRQHHVGELAPCRFGRHDHPPRRVRGASDGGSSRAPSAPARLLQRSRLLAAARAVLDEGGPNLRQRRELLQLVISDDSGPGRGEGRDASSRCTLDPGRVASAHRLCRGRRPTMALSSGPCGRPPDQYHDAYPAPPAGRRPHFPPRQ
jgi:hypothetical protein